MGSARVQALRFVENLTNTVQYSLILDVQPVSMSIEKLQKMIQVDFLREQRSLYKFDMSLS